MKKIIAHIFAAAVILASSPAFTHEYHIGDLEIGHPWSRATLPVAKVGSGYLTVTNEGAASDRLLGASSPVAGRVEIHSMEIKDNVMTMRPIAEGIEIPAGETVDLAPGGLHLMLLDLKQPLKEGDNVSLTLEFEHAGTVDVELAVGPAGNADHDHHDHDDHSDASNDSNHQH